jgi:hypothetical protein
VQPPTTRNKENNNMATKTKHSIVTLPGFEEYGVMNYEVNSTDVLAGLGIGLLGVGAAKLAANKLAITLPPIVVSAFPLIGGALAGVGAFMLQKNSNPNRGKGHMVGAIGAGAAVTAMDMLRTNDSTKEYFADITTLRLGRYGVMVRSPNYRRPGLNGVMVRDTNYSPRQRATMSALGRASMDAAEASDLESIM